MTARHAPPAPRRTRVRGRRASTAHRQARALWWLVVALGAGCLAHALQALWPLPWPHALQIAVAAGFAVFVGLCPVRLPGSRETFVTSDLFIFLLLLLQGPEAAGLAAAAEALVGAWRTEAAWRRRLLGPAAALVSMTLAGLLLSHVAPPLAGLPPGSASVERLPLPLLLAALAVAAALHAALPRQLIGAVQRLRHGLPPRDAARPTDGFGRAGVASVGAALLAGALVAGYRSGGGTVLVVALPMLLLLILGLHFYALQRQAAEAMAAAQDQAAAAAAAQLKALQASEQRFASAFTHAAIGMALLTLDGHMLQANPALRTLLGLPEALPPRFHDLVEPEFHAAFEAALRRAPAGAGQGIQLELRCRRTDGSALWLLVHGGFFHEPGTEAARLILQLQDISARRQAEAGLHRLAFHDPLTGLPNRRQFMGALATAVAHHQAAGQHAYALMYLDFDRFKQVNDSLGHQAGDELLVQLARRIQENLRPTDVVGRLGGDEFAVLLPQLLDEDDALQLAERLLQALRRPFRVAGHALFASASIGITFSRFGYASAEAALQDADGAMYQAKAAGKARYAMHQGAPAAATPDHATLAQALPAALAAEELQLVYQPVLALADGRLRGFEALLRWRHPVLGQLAPASFIPVAEQCGLITDLSDFVLARACRQLARWQRLAPHFADLSIAVNLSGQDIASPVFLPRLERALQAAGLAPGHLVLELTEEAVMGHLDAAQGNLQALRSLGVRLSVDDFGSGYSSLAQLARLPIDSVKIDRRFVQALTTGEVDATDAASAAAAPAADSDVVRTLVQMGSALGRTVVAEGIETALQAEQLRQLGPHLLGQGYHLAEPLSPDAATRWLKARAAQPAAA